MVRIPFIHAFFTQVKINPNTREIQNTVSEADSVINAIFDASHCTITKSQTAGGCFDHSLIFHLWSCHINFNQIQFITSEQFLIVNLLMLWDPEENEIQELKKKNIQSNII